MSENHKFVYHACFLIQQQNKQTFYRHYFAEFKYPIRSAEEGNEIAEKILEGKNGALISMSLVSHHESQDKP